MTLDQLIETGAGFRYQDPGFSGPGRIALKVLLGIPAGLRESILFTSSFLCCPLQKAVQRVLGGTRMVRVELTRGPLLGCAFELRSSEKYFLMGDGYEPVVQAVLKHEVRPGEVVYDIGAHIGYMSLLFAVLCGPNGHVFAFEPSPVNFGRLRRNIGLNRQNNITPVKKAASDTEGDAFLTERGSESQVVQGVEDPAGKLSTIKTVRLDDFVYRDQFRPPSLVKIDVEGYAGRVLGGMGRILRDFSPRIMFEVHNEAETAEVFSILSGQLYSFDDIDGCRAFPRHILASRA